MLGAEAFHAAASVCAFPVIGARELAQAIDALPTRSVDLYALGVVSAFGIGARRVTVRVAITVAVAVSITITISVTINVTVTIDIAVHVHVAVYITVTINIAVADSRHKTSQRSKVGAQRLSTGCPVGFLGAPDRTRRAPFVTHRALHRC